MAGTETTAVNPETEATAPEVVAEEAAAPVVAATDWQAEYAKLPTSGKRNYQQAADTVAARLEGFRGLFLKADGTVRTQEEIKDIFQKVANGELGAEELAGMGFDAAKLMAGSPFALTDLFKGAIEGAGNNLTNGGTAARPSLVGSLLSDIWTGATNVDRMQWENLVNTLSGEHAFQIGVITAQALEVRDGARAKSDAELGGIMGFVNGALDFTRGIWAHFNSLVSGVPLLGDLIGASQYKGMKGEQILETWKQEDDAKFVDEQIRKVHPEIPSELVSAVSGRVATANGTVVQAGLPAYEAADAEIGAVARGNQRRLNLTDPAKSPAGSAFKTEATLARWATDFQNDPLGTSVGLAADTAPYTVPAALSYGFVEGVARQTRGGGVLAERAAKLQTASDELLEQSLKDGARAKQLRADPKARRMLERGAEAYETRAAEATGRAAELDAKAVTQAAQAEGKATKFAEPKTPAPKHSFMRPFGEKAAEDLADKKGIAARITNITRGPGRAIGDAVGRLVVDSTSQAGHLLQAPGAALTAFKAVPAAAADAGPLGHLLNFGSKVFEGGLALGSKLVKGIPLIGGAVNAGVMFLGSSETASAEYGRSVSFWEALDLDLKSGKINQKQHDYYRMLQAGDIGTGVGGFITLGVTETAKMSLELADGKYVRRYLPASIASTLMGGAKNEQQAAQPAAQTAVNAQTDGALGPVDPGIAAALTTRPVVNVRKALTCEQIDNILSGSTFTKCTSVDVGVVHTDGLNPGRAPAPAAVGESRVVAQI